MKIKKLIMIGILINAADFYQYYGYGYGYNYGEDEVEKPWHKKSFLGKLFSN